MRDDRAPGVRADGRLPAWQEPRHHHVDLFRSDDRSVRASRPNGTFSSAAAGSKDCPNYKRAAARGSDRPGCLADPLPPRPRAATCECLCKPACCSCYRRFPGNDVGYAPLAFKWHTTTST